MDVINWVIRGCLTFKVLDSSRNGYVQFSGSVFRRTVRTRAMKLKFFEQQVSEKKQKGNEI